MQSRQHLTGIHIQPRDLALLCGLFESRYLTSAHIAEIYFAGKREMAKKRIQKLKATGLVGTRSRGFGVSDLLRLTPRAIHFLSAGGHLAGYPRLPLAAQLRRTRIRPLTIDHELAVADVKAAFSRALRAREHLSLLEFGTWPRLYEFASVSARGTRTTVAPDGFIRIHAHGLESRFFVEVDRSTESTSVLVSRIAAYLRFYRSGGFAVRSGLPRDDYATVPFRVLVVCKSGERRDSLAATLYSARPQVRTFALFGTVDDVSKKPLGAIWRAPIDMERRAPLRSLLTS